MRARVIAPQLWDTRPLVVPLEELRPLEVQEVSGDQPGREILAAALAEFHYLGYRSSVGENAQYLVTHSPLFLIGVCYPKRRNRRAQNGSSWKTRGHVCISDVEYLNGCRIRR